MDAGLSSLAPKRILVLKPSSLGDIVHTLPAVAALRAHWPQSEIAWMVNSEWAPLLEGNPAISRIIEFPRRQFRGLRGWLRIPRWLGSLGGWEPDLTIDFQGLLRTALIARFMGSKKTVGLSDAREGSSFFYNQVVPLPKEPLHAVDRYRRLVLGLGVREIQTPVFNLPLGNAPGASLPKRFVLLHPFSRGEGKSMDENDVIQLCRDLDPQPVVLVGSDRILGKTPANVTNLLGKTSLLELIWLIRRADFTVSVDSGPMHMAAAITPRLLSIHTWSDPRLVGPYNPEAWIWKNGVFGRISVYSPGSAEKIDAPSPRVIADFLRTQLTE